jgi:hypothetical protein
MTIRGQADIILGLLHVLWSMILDLRGFCSPTSFYVPLGSATLGLIFTFRALETNSINLPSTKEYETSCPENSRRTQSAIWVKLFAATVTTICIQGHSASLASADSLSWQWEIYRVLRIPSLGRRCIVLGDSVVRLHRSPRPDTRHVEKKCHPTISNSQILPLSSGHRRKRSSASSIRQSGACQALLFTQRHEMVWPHVHSHGAIWAICSSWITPRTTYPIQYGGND